MIGAQPGAERIFIFFSYLKKLSSLFVTMGEQE